MIVADMNNVSVSSTVKNVRHDLRAVPLAKEYFTHVKRGSDYQLSPIVHSLQTDILTKALRVSLLVI